jgi:hypothetical protein
MWGWCHMPGHVHLIPHTSGRRLPATRSVEGIPHPLRVGLPRAKGLFDIDAPEPDAFERLRRAESIG